MKDLPAFRRDPLEFLASRADAGGRAVPLALGFPTLLVCDPADVHQVFVANHVNYGKTRRLTSRRGRRISGRGLLTSSGKEHRRQRRMLSPMFQRQAVERFGEVAARSTAELVDGWEDGTVIDVANEAMRLASTTRLRTLLSTAAPADLDAVAEGILLRRRWFERAFSTLLPIDELLPTARAREYRRAMALVDAVLSREITERRGASAPPPDLLTALVQARYEDGTTMSDSQVRDEVLTVAHTGHETIGEALSWTLHLVAAHPHVEERLASEADDGYARMVVAEAMRLFPPTWIVVRTAYGPDVLPSGARVRRGSKLYLSQWVMHRLPRLWPEPERFDPERFTEEARRARPRYAYFPFGAGPRVCIGEALAARDLALMLTTIVRRVRLSPVSGDVVAPEPGITLHPRGGIPMRVSGRVPRRTG